MRVAIAELERFAAELLVAAGAGSDDAVVAAAFLTRTDAFGVHSHGLKNLGPYIEKAKLGALDLGAKIDPVVDRGAVALFDAHSAIGMVAGTRAMESAIERAAAHGISIAVVRDSTHFGAAGVYALQAAERGFVGVVLSNVDPNMTVPGARGKVIGNNPIAYAVPAGEHRPVIFDIALSAVASLKVVAARDAGQPVPEGWIVDGTGAPTTDPSRYPDEGAMLPMAAHKGYGFALLVDILTGALAGSPTSDQVPSWLFEPDRPNVVTHTFLVIDPSWFGEGFEGRVEGYLTRLHAVPLAAGASEILHPGQLEWRRLDDAIAHGIDLPAETVASLEAAAAAGGVTTPW